MKVVIAYPPFKDKGSPMLTQNRQFQWFSVPSFIYPCVSASGATLLEKEGFEVIWADALARGWSMEEFLKTIAGERPELVAMESKAPIIKSHWRLIEKLKEIHPQGLIALMGDHVTAFPEESLLMSQVDFIITGGNYDISLLGLARHLRDKSPLPLGIWMRDGEDGLRSTGPFDLSYDLNLLPFVDRKLTMAHLYGEKWKKRLPFFYTMVGRDCPWHRCTFCAWTTLHPTFMVRRPESLLDEIGVLIEEHGAREIFDDTGTFPGGEWLEVFCRGMVERGYHNHVLFSCNMRFDYLIKPGIVDLMKKAGFRKVKAGLESANQTTLDKIHKGIKVHDIIEGCRLASEAGLDVHLTVMVGYPWESREEACRTLELAHDLMAKGHAEMLQATVVVPYPGTPLYEYGVREGLFRFDPKEYERFDMTEPVFKTPDMAPEEVMALCGGVYKAFMTPLFILRQLSRVRGWEDINYMARGAKAVLGHIKDFVQRR